MSKTISRHQYISILLSSRKYIFSEEIEKKYNKTHTATAKERSLNIATHLTHPWFTLTI